MTAGLARVRTAWLGIRPNTRGAIWMFFCGALFAGADGLAKYFTREGFDVFQIACVLYVLGLMFLMPVVMAAGLGSLATGRPAMHAGRATISALSQVLVYYALAHLYVADVTAINFVRPLFIVILAVLFLREHVDWRRWTATIIGFGGVIVMARPGSGTMPELAALAAVGSTALLAISMAMVARYADSESPLRFVFYYHAGGALLFVVPALLAWQTPTMTHWIMFLLLALLSVVAQTCAVRAYAIGEASVVGPVDYLRLISAAAVGYALFGEFPGAPTWIGAAIIVASALYVARRGRFGARKAR